jgi:Ca2+-binding EF-hand superfamily protein
MVKSHFDRDGDGFITCEELYDVFKKMGRNYSDKEIKRMIKAIDTDGIRNLNFIL